MRNHLRVLIFGAAALFAFAPVLPAQTGGAPPDLSGVWMRTRDGGTFGDELPPMRAEAKRVFDDNRRGQEPGRDEGLDELDPSIYCLPHGTPRAYTVNYPFEIVQAPGVVHILYESSLMRRRIVLNGPAMPESYPPSFMGYSTGRYDGDTLVVLTTGLDDSTWIDGRGIPHSSGLKLTERIRRASQNALEIEFTFDDPQTFTRAWTDKRTFQLRSDWQLMEHIGYCEDRFRYNNAQKIFRGTVDWQSPEQAAGR